REEEKVYSVRELTNFQFWKAVRTELLATLLLAMTGCGVALQCTEATPADDLKVALAFGLTVATLVQCVGHVSGGHMNPAVTVGMLVTGNISPARAVCYSMAQCTGAIAGTAVLYGLIPATLRGDLGLTRVHAAVSLAQAFGIEFIITFVYAFAVFANLDPKRKSMGSRSLAIGFAALVGNLFGFHYTGASMNPARSLGPAVVLNSWEHHWIYWLGPVLGGVLGGFTYEYTHDSKRFPQRLRLSFLTVSASELPRSETVLSNCTEMTSASVDDLHI
ncbi:PREDICTED: lens fiber major intrinsic protein-like, partial [Priapulus caudatus]|uniref:Lens fiber major intrinsic protein-like n=1 Tax=Priapulus caudatus TaxID=37621 RepID=A0ABM1E8I5_PRICU